VARTAGGDVRVDRLLGVRFVPLVSGPPAPG
jgi:hypothetical protein